MINYNWLIGLNLFAIGFVAMLIVLDMIATGKL